MSPLKILTGAALGVGAIAGLAYVKNLKRAQADLQAVPKASIHELGLSGLTIRIDVLLKNPTKGSFSLKFPFVTLLYKGAIVGSSQSVNKDIRLPAFGEATIEKILVKLPAIQLFSVAFGLMDALKNGKAVALTIQTESTVNLGWMSIPYKNSQEVIINNPK